MNKRHMTHLTLLTIMMAVSGMSLAYADSATVEIAFGTSIQGCEVDNSCFTPDSVTINVGDTVTWANTDTVVHTIISGVDSDDPNFGDLFDSGPIYPGSEYTHQFDEAGTFQYTTEFYPWMKGVVVVTDSMMMKDDDMMMADDDDMMMSKLPETVTIGILHPRSGGLSGLGTQLEAATDLAVADFNEYLQESGAGWTLKAAVEDTATSPVTAVLGIEALYSKGINLVVGPAASTSTSQVKKYADDQDMLIFSCCSTSPALAIAGDSVYRMVSDDTNQGKAIAELLSTRGVTALVPIWRADTYGDGLHDAAKNNFEASGGIVAEGIRYDQERKEFGLEVSDLADQVQDMIDEHGEDKVAVLLIAFEESIQIVQSANQYDVLKQVDWYGSEAVASSVDLSDQIVSEFVESTEFLSTDIYLSQGELAQSVLDRLKDTLGIDDPTSFTFAAYDAVQILARAIEYTGSTETSEIKAVLHSVASEYQGALPDSELNENGDLVKNDYAVKIAMDGKWVTTQKYLIDYNLITSATQPEGIIEVGSLYPITGQSSATGFATRDATALGAEDFNKYLASIGEHGWELKVIEEDSASVALVALEKAQTFHARGIDIIIGPRPSAEAKQVKTYTDKTDMIAISCCSTTPSLSIAGDSIYRLAPDDANQGIALATLFETEGIEAIATITRNDAYGIGLLNATVTEFTNRGYEVAEAINYDSVAAATPGLLAAELNDNVQELVDKHGTDKVAVLITGFAESVQIMEAVSEYDILGEIRWFGAETFTSSTNILTNAITNELVTSTNFTSLAIATTATDTEKYIINHFMTEYGEVPTQYIRNAYDIPWLVGLSMLHTGATDAISVKEVLGDVGANYVGAVGKAAFNEAGDLVPGDYSIWTVTEDGWKEIGNYSPLTKEITYYAAMSDNN